MSIQSANGYTHGGLDADANRSSVRIGLTYYRGEAIGRWPISDRRRVVTVNGVANSPSHQQWEILTNDQFPNHSNLINQINSVAAPVLTPVNDYENWAPNFSFPADLSGPNDDPDGDGAKNIQEFYANTDPLLSNSTPPAELSRIPQGFSYRYQRSIDLSGVTHALETGPLDNFTTYIPPEGTTTVVQTGDSTEEVTVSLPSDFGPFIRERLTMP